MATNLMGMLTSIFCSFIVNIYLLNIKQGTRWQLDCNFLYEECARLVLEEPRIILFAVYATCYG